MMKIFFLRHAVAEERADGQDHPNRRLTGVGLKQALRVGKFARQQGLAFHRIFSSPYRRALETAQHFLEPLHNPPAIETVKWLAAGESGTAALKAVHALIRNESKNERKNNHMLLIGHEPDLSNLIAALLGIKEAPSIRMRKAGIACLAVSDRKTGQCQLRWLLTPDLC